MIERATVVPANRLGFSWICVARLVSFHECAENSPKSLWQRIVRSVTVNPDFLKDTLTVDLYARVTSQGVILKRGNTMALVILEDCINCDACRAECPTESVHAGADIYEIDGNTCVECVGYFDQPKCVELCPIDCIVPMVA